MRRRPIGQILVEKNEISEEDLTAALAEQERSGRRLGEILIEQGRTSWLALARAIAEQVLDIKSEPLDTGVNNRPSDPVELVRAMAERIASLPPVPDPLPPPSPDPVAPDPEHDLARAVAEQVANLGRPPVKETTLLHLTPSAPRDEDPEEKLHSVEILLMERQRAFIELVATAETLRMKVQRLEDMLEERTREIARLRAARVAS
jgi:hypothetical protein